MTVTCLATARRLRRRWKSLHDKFKFIYLNKGLSTQRSASTVFAKYERNKRLLTVNYGQPKRFWFIVDVSQIFSSAKNRNYNRSWSPRLEERLSVMLTVRPMYHTDTDYDPSDAETFTTSVISALLLRHQSNGLFISGHRRHRAGSESLPLFAQTRINTCATGPVRLHALPAKTPRQRCSRLILSLIHI